MKAALLALSLLGQSPLQISDCVPVIDVEALCSDVPSSFCGRPFLPPCFHARSLTGSSQSSQATLLILR